MLCNLMKSLFLALLCISAGFAYGQQVQNGDVRIGVLAKRGEGTALTKWQATADYLTQRVEGHTFRIVPLSFNEIPSVVRSGLIDFVIVNPAIYADLTVKYDIRRILTLVNRASNAQSASSFGSVVFTRSDHTGALTWDTFANKHWAGVHETSLGGWILVQYELKKENVPVSYVTFSGTHDQVVRDVLDGRADVGVVRTDTLERMAAEEKLSFDDIKVLHPKTYKNFPLMVSSALVPEWPISKLEHVPESLAKDVASSLLDMSADAPAALAANIDGWNIPANYQVIHDILKELNLAPYEENMRQQLLALLQAYWYWLVGVALLLGLPFILTVNVIRLNKRLHVQQGVLKQSEEQFRSLFQQAAVGFVYASPTGMIRKANQSIQMLVNRSEVELQKLNINDLVHSDDLSEVNGHFEAMRRNEISRFYLQTRIDLKANGEPIWVLLTISAMRNTQGEITDLIAVFDEITQLKQLEHRLHTEQHLKTVILDIAGDGILGLDTEGKHTFVNPTAARLLGYEPEEILGLDSHSCWHHTRSDGSVFPSCECPITSVLQDGIVHRGVDELFWRKDGSSFAAEYISTPMSEGDQITGAVLIFRERDTDNLHYPNTSDFSRVL